MRVGTNRRHRSRTAVAVRKMRRMTTNAPVAPASENRSLLLIAAGVVALIIITVAVVVLTGNERAQEYPADSPEGTLQRYLAAYADGDVEGAYAYFSTRVQERMDLDAYQRSIDSYGDMEMADASRRVIFDRRTGGDERVQLHLTVEEFYGDGLDGSTYRSPRQVRLVREGGEWRIDEPLVWLDPAPVFEGAHP